MSICSANQSQGMRTTRQRLASSGSRRAGKPCGCPWSGWQTGRRTCARGSRPRSSEWPGWASLYTAKPMWITQQSGIRYQEPGSSCTTAAPVHTRIRTPAQVASEVKHNARKDHLLSEGRSLALAVLVPHEGGLEGDLVRARAAHQRRDLARKQR